MKSIIVIAIAFFGLSVMAQNTSSLPSIFTNKKTSKHVHVPGTRFYMIPPEGFHAIPGKTCFGKTKDFEFEFQELKSPRYLKAVYESYGFRITDSVSTKFDNYQAVVYQLSSSGYQMCILSFWDSTFTGSVTLVCPPPDSALFETAKNAFTSVYYDPLLVPDPFEVANFKVDESKSEFKFSFYNSGIFTYTMGGIKLSEAPSTTDPSIDIFIQEKDPNLSASALVERAKFVLQDRGMKIIEANMLSTTKINQYEAAEMEVYGRMNFIKYKAYIASIKDAENFILILAFIPVNYDEVMLKMKDFSRLITLGVKKK